MPPPLPMFLQTPMAALATHVRRPASCFPTASAVMSQHLGQVLSAAAPTVEHGIMQRDRAQVSCQLVFSSALQDARSLTWIRDWCLTLMSCFKITRLCTRRAGQLAGVHDFLTCCHCPAICCPCFTPQPRSALCSLEYLSLMAAGLHHAPQLPSVVSAQQPAGALAVLSTRQLPAEKLFCLTNLHMLVEECAFQAKTSAYTAIHLVDCVCCMAVLQAWLHLPRPSQVHLSATE